MLNRVPSLKLLVLCAGVLTSGAACDGNEHPPSQTSTPPGKDIGSGPGTLPDGGPAKPQSPWVPAPGTSWQWQLKGTVDTSLDVEVYDIDLFDAPQEVIDQLQAQGRKVICYFSAGSFENWRADAGDFPSAALGNPLEGWPGERWIDTRDEGIRDVMRARLDLAVEKGCDAVEPDNVDGYQNNPGFPLTAESQLDFNRFLAEAAHERGLSIGLKNSLELVPELVDAFDWALNEECFQYDECEALTPFVESGKAVFHVEYGPGSLADTVCPVTTALGFSTLIKNLELDPWRVACP